jgi:predicted GIY-YIG superfamily endonuclease
VYKEEANTEIEAKQRERQIKKWSRKVVKRIGNR